jgi:hypothetical protein
VPPPAPPGKENGGQLTVGSLIRQKLGALRYVFGWIFTIGRDLFGTLKFQILSNPLTNKHPPEIPQQHQAATKI